LDPPFGLSYKVTLTITNANTKLTPHTNKDATSSTMLFKIIYVNESKKKKM
jgi:hypothetical protein